MANRQSIYLKGLRKIMACAVAWQFSRDLILRVPSVPGCLHKDRVNPLKLWTVTQRLTINKKYSAHTRLRHCVDLATMSLPPYLAPSLDARRGP